MPEGADLFHGNDLLVRDDPTYPRDATYGLTEYTVERALRALDADGVRPTAGLPSPVEAAADQFVGYLLFDAWIGNTDRHHENWAVLRRGDARELAPTFDHATSLGRELPVTKVRHRLESNDEERGVVGYVRRARSAFYAPGQTERPVDTLAAFSRAARLRPEAARWWCERLAAVQSTEMHALIDRTPEDRMSDTRRAFALRILVTNQRRIHDALA